jgi:hypothetical protein
VVDRERTVTQAAEAAGVSIRCAAVLLQAVLGTLGWFGFRALAAWAFPPLELLESWERSRWDKLRTWALQLVSLALATAGIILAVVLASPSGPAR